MDENGEKKERVSVRNMNRSPFSNRICLVQFSNERICH